MSSILWQALEAEATGNRAPVLCNIEVETPTIFDRPEPWEDRKEFLIRAVVSCKFWAKDSDYKYARQNAIQMLQQQLYAGALSLTSRMRSAAYEGNMEELQKLIEALEKEIGL